MNNKQNNNNNYSHSSKNELLKTTLALVLAGGKGTRLKGLTKEIAKPAVPFGGKYKIIDFTLSNCVHSGIRRIGVLTQFMAHDLIGHIQRGWGFFNNPYLNEGISIIPAQQRKGNHWYRGTADAVYQNLDLINKSTTKQVLILGGDHIYKMDYSRMLSFHAENNADVTVACINKNIDEASSFGVMQLNKEGQIIKFEEKPENPEPSPEDPNKALVSMGIYIFNVDILCKELQDSLSDPNYSHDFGHNIIPKLLKDYKVSGYVFNGDGHPDNSAYWKDVGNIDEYYNANMDLLSPLPELNIYNDSWPLITEQLQRPGAKFVFNESKRKGYAVDSIVSAGTVVSGAEIERSLISMNCRIEDYSFIGSSILLPNVKIGKNCKIRNAIISSETEIPDNTVIGYDENNDRRNYEISEKGIILV